MHPQNNDTTVNKRNISSFIVEYNNLNEVFACEKNLNFMNHGYSPVDERISSDVMLKQSASLYLKTVDGIVGGTSLLEVGCGRGGGLDTIQTHYPDVELYGCDICPTNIVYSKYFNNSIDYRVGNAMDLPYEDNKFDYVLNIESSHCYDDIEKFYFHCNRVLKPNGKLLYSDLVEGYDDINSKYSYLKNYFSVDSFDDITENVIQSCKELCETLREQAHRPGYNNLYNIISQKYDIYRKRENYFFIMQLTVKK